MIDSIAVLDFGSQYSQLIARRVREAQVYCELFPWDAPAEKIRAALGEPRGYILSGGPASVYAPGAPTIPAYVLEFRPAHPGDLLWHAGADLRLARQGGAFRRT